MLVVVRLLGCRCTGQVLSRGRVFGGTLCYPAVSRSSQSPSSLVLPVWSPGSKQELGPAPACTFWAASTASLLQAGHGRAPCSLMACCPDFSTLEANGPTGDRGQCTNTACWRWRVPNEFIYKIPATCLG